MEKHIMDIIPWKNGLSLNISNLSEPLDCWSDSDYILEIIDSSSNILITKELQKTRLYFGTQSIISNDIIFMSHMRYHNSSPTLMIDFYKIHISDSEIFIEHLKQHQIKTIGSIGNTTGRICRNSITASSSLSDFNIIYGDLDNYDYFHCVQFNQQQIISESRFEFNKIYEPEFNQIYMMYPDIENPLMIYANAYGHDSSIIELGLFRVQTSKCFSIITVQLPDGFNYGNKNEKMLDCMIYDIFNHTEKRLYCLTRIKIQYDINPLKVGAYFIDVLFDIENHEIITLSPPIKFDYSDDYPGYFGIRPHAQHQ